MTEQNFWRSKAAYIYAESLEELCKKLTEFAKDKWVIAWQIFREVNAANVEAIVTFKVQE